jgi:uncharacterized protein (DUF433 family)
MMDRIVIDKRILHGKPVVKGTRVPVDIVIGSLAGGMSFEEYGIQREDILACLAYAARLINEERVYPLEKVAEVASA